MKEVKLIIKDKYLNIVKLALITIEEIIEDGLSNNLFLQSFKCLLLVVWFLWLV